MGYMAELIFIMREEADAAGASSSLLAEPGAVLCRVQPALKHAMGELTVVAAGAATGAPEVGARHGSVGVLARVNLTIVPNGMAGKLICAPVPLYLLTNIQNTFKSNN